MDVRAFASPRRAVSRELVNQAGTPTSSIGMGSCRPDAGCFPWPQTPPIANGAVQAYELCSDSRHVLDAFASRHAGASLMTAPLIVHSPEDMREDRRKRA